MFQQADSSHHCPGVGSGHLLSALEAESAHLPPVPRLPGGRPSFVLSRPQPHEPWFLKAASTSPPQLWRGREGDLSASSDRENDRLETIAHVLGDFIHRCQLRDDVAFSSGAGTISSCSCVSCSDTDCSAPAADPYGGVGVQRGGLGDSAAAPDSLPISTNSCSRLVGSTSGSTCSCLSLVASHLYVRTTLGTYYWLHTTYRLATAWYADIWFEIVLELQQ